MLFLQHNYGSMVQANATYMALDKLGYENETIDISGFNGEKKAKNKYFAKAALTSDILLSKAGMAKKVLNNIAYAVRPETPEDYRTYFDERIHLIEVQNFTRSIDPAKDFRAIPEVKKIADEIQPDIIHLPSSKAGAIGRIAFNGKNVPLFYTPHGYSF